MITLLLSLAVICFMIDAKNMSEQKSNALKAVKSLGCIIAFGVFFMAFFSIAETHPASTSWAFRTGELVPERTLNDAELPEFSVMYRQKSWWKWKTDGEWLAVLNKDGEWVFAKGSKWEAVPLEVYISDSDDRAMEVDNRGWHEQ